MVNHKAYVTRMRSVTVREVMGVEVFGLTKWKIGRLTQPV